ncbi:acyl-CoA dehydrogenase family protein [Phenylobacterium montanum]|uniref:Acyl-CoA dehydrogenase family protein n=1 Tax=Phenylobacterium montanum TaxID=2823693 RepID=A0A975G2U0_9CAUL|nr:acyl-CoA dehydrogenase family protein [Caulobacter sp. S6]QUD90103.1 acyl-CoA dehydrogenase family protein [Caulobacter sp. S6]
MANLAPTITPAPPQDDAAFLAEVRAFLATALTPDLRQAGRQTLGVHSDIEACRVWHGRLYRRGWIAPAWPEAFGGAGWSARQRFLFDRECALNDAPVLFAGGIRSLGPLLIEMGTPAQRARFLPRILSGADLWCQGFSEPGAGSDLAALSTRAVRDGDGYRITGSKIWTTGAHLANRMFAIVRTSTREKRQQGLTFLLIDMNSPGITVAPITSLSGEHELNQVFFDDVRVPVENRVGEEDDGWSVAKRLMALARSNNTPAALVRRALNRVQAAVVEAASPLEPTIRPRLAQLMIELEAFEQLELAALPGGRPLAGEQTTPSMLKLVGSELHQKVAELAAEVAGPYAAAALPALGLASDALDAGARAMAKHLDVRAASIYSGSSETQRNVIAGRMLAG